MCSCIFRTLADGISVRMVTDFTKINKFVIRPVHQFHLVQDIVQCIPAGTAFFAKMDAIHGYFQLTLDEESSRLTTFLLPSGPLQVFFFPTPLPGSVGESYRYLGLACHCPHRRDQGQLRPCCALSYPQGARCWAAGPRGVMVQAVIQ